MVNLLMVFHLLYSCSIIFDILDLNTKKQHKMRAGVIRVNLSTLETEERLDVILHSKESIAFDLQGQIIQLIHTMEHDPGTGSLV
jgi:hypothetical protein